MFGRATITLGIGPHSSLFYFVFVLCWTYKIVDFASSRSAVSAIAEFLLHAYGQFRQSNAVRSLNDVGEFNTGVWQA